MDDDMKMNAAAVKRLRAERAWSQEHLADIANVSLRTIQRVEADASGSAETVMALAAAFGVDVRELSAVDQAPREVTPVTPVAATTLRYRLGGALALLASMVAASGAYLSQALSQALPQAGAWESGIIVVNVALMIAIAAGLYAGLGWYFSGAAAQGTPARRTVQFGFVSGAVFLAFASFSASPKSLVLTYLPVLLIACAMRFALDRHVSRKRHNMTAL